jgi:hypothetical protein
MEEDLETNGKKWNMNSKKIKWKTTLKKTKKMIPLKFRDKLSWGWLSSLRFFGLLII